MGRIDGTKVRLGIDRTAPCSTKETAHLAKTYQLSQAIEQRLEKVLRLIRTGRYSTPTLADEVGVSILTVSRCVNALRERGHDIACWLEPTRFRRPNNQKRSGFRAVQRALRGSVHQLRAFSPDFLAGKLIVA